MRLFIDSSRWRGVPWYLRSGEGFIRETRYLVHPHDQWRLVEHQVRAVRGRRLVSVVLGVAMVAESLLLLWIGWSRFGLATNNDALTTFSFLTLLYFAVFSIVSARERRWFWTTMPSKTFLSALAAETVTGTVLTFVGLPGLMPLPRWQTLTVFGFAMVSCLAVNDAVKVAMIKWRVLDAVAKMPVDITPQLAGRA